MVLLSGCDSDHSPPFFLTYDSEEIIRDQSKVATVLSTVRLEFDGVEVNVPNMRSTYMGKYNNKKHFIFIADVLPGEHTVTLLTVPPVSIKFYFEAGHIYRTIKTLEKPYFGLQKISLDEVQKGYSVKWFGGYRNIEEFRKNAVFEKKQ